MVKRGRPSSYDPHFCELIIDYFEKAAAASVRKLAPVVTTTLGEKPSQKEEVRSICAELPTLEGFARSIGFDSKTVWNWTNEHPEFFRAHARAKDIQFQLLVDRGLTGQYNSAAFMFVAQNITGMRQNIAVDHSGQVGQVIQLVVAPSGAGAIDGKTYDITTLIEDADADDDQG